MSEQRHRSLFSRLVASHVILALITLIVAGGILAALLGSYVFETKQSQLLAQGSEIARLYGDIVFGRSDPATAANTIGALSNMVQANVSFANTNGLILFASQSGLLGAQVGPDVVAQMASGHSIAVLDRRFGQSALTVVVPVIGTAPGNPTPVIGGGVILTAPVSTLTVVTAHLRQRFVWAALASIALSLLLAYWISRSLSGPIRKLTDAARSLAAGDYSQRVALPAGDELGELAATFNRAAAELQKLEETRREFIADVSHELRRPLTRLLAAVEAVADGIITDPAELRQHLSDTRGEVARTARLVDDMLQLSRLDSGTFTLTRERVELTGLARRLSASLTGAAAQAGITLDCSGDADVFVDADPGRIEQVLANLIENALRFTPSGGKVSLTVSRSDASARIAVTDTGAGIPADQLARIWERFYKVDRSRAGQGSGLGLAIVRRIVELHGGSVSVASEAGAGTTFTIALPLLDTDS